MCLFWAGQPGSVGSLGAAHGTSGWVPDGRATAAAKLVLASGVYGDRCGRGKRVCGERRMHWECVMERGGRLHVCMGRVAEGQCMELIHRCSLYQSVRTCVPSSQQEPSCVVLVVKSCPRSWPSWHWGRPARSGTCGHSCTETQDYMRA